MNVQNLRLMTVIGILCLGHTATGQDYRYAVFEMPSLDDSLQWDGAGEANLAGDVVGASPVGSVWFPQAVVWPRDGGMIELGTLGGDHSGAGSINALGEIVGASGFEPGQGFFVAHAFLWRNGEMMDLGTLGGESSGANAINNNTQIVGGSEFEMGNFRSAAFVWHVGQMRILRAPLNGYDGHYAWDINESGDIVGEGAGLDQQFNAVLWINEHPNDLGSLSGQGSAANAINDLGHIVGQSKASNGKVHAVVWIDRQIIDIHSGQFGPRTYSWGMDINNAGQILGSIGTTLSNRQLFLREMGQGMTLVKDLVPPWPRVRVRMDRGHINDSGMITAAAYLEGRLDIKYAHLLTPVNPTMNLSAPTPGIAGQVNTLTITGVIPGERVDFYYSLHGGGERIPGCDLQQNALQLDQPKFIGSSVADANGIASVSKMVPSAAQGQWILMQAVVPNECAISQLVVHRFE